MNTIVVRSALLRGLVLGWAALSVVACSGVVERDQRARLLPRDPGIYATSGEQLVRLNGNPEWERTTWKQRSNLGSGVEFVIFHPALRNFDSAKALDSIRIDLVSRVRSEVSADGTVNPLFSTTWATAELEEFRVPVELRLVDMRRDMLVAVPQQPLGSGLYSLTLRLPGGVVTTRFGIGWPAVDKEAYSAVTCVDRYEGTPDRYRKCADQQTAVAREDGLNVYLVSPDSSSMGATRTMTVEGVIVNNSKTAALPVPPMTGFLHRDDGAVLRRWRFPAPVEVLDPGQSAAFRTEVLDPPAGAHSVRVRFDGH